VLVSNSSMLRMFQRGAHDLTLTTSAGVHEVKMIFRPSRQNRPIHLRADGPRAIVVSAIGRASCI
jgi:hypothetical protein